MANLGDRPQNKHLKPLDSKRAAELGRKSKRGKSFKTIFRELVDQELESKNPITKEVGKFTAGEVIAMQQLIKAMKGDRYAAQMIMDRMEGQAEQVVKTQDIVVATQDDKEALQKDYGEK